MLDKITGGQMFHVHKCAECGREIIVTHQMVQNGTYMYQQRADAKKNYCCGWKCYRQFKYKHLMKKNKLTAQDEAWLRYARFKK